MSSINCKSVFSSINDKKNTITLWARHLLPTDNMYYTQIVNNTNVKHNLVAFII